MLLATHGEWVPAVQGSSGLRGGAFPLLVVKVGGTCVGTQALDVWEVHSCLVPHSCGLAWRNYGAGRWSILPPSLSMATVGEIV